MVLIIGINLPANAGLIVSPEKFEFTPDKDKNYITQAITVKSTDKTPQRYRVYTNYFELTPNAAVMVPKNDPKGEKSLSSFVNDIHFNPYEFTVMPGKTQKIRFTIVNVGKMEKGDKRALIFIEEKQGREKIVSSKDGHGAKILLKTRYGVPIYIEKGQLAKRAVVNDLILLFENKNQYASVDIASVGKSKVRVTGKIFAMQNDKVVSEASFKGFPILAGNKGVSKARFKTPLAKGSYKIKAEFFYKDENGKKVYIKKEYDNLAL